MAGKTPFKRQNRKMKEFENSEAEESFRESEQSLANIIDFLPDATFAIDMMGKVIIWNLATEDMTGVKASDILGKGDHEYAIPFYGMRKPLLVDLVLKENKKLEKNNYFYLKREDRFLIAETDLLTINKKDVFLWGKAGPLYKVREISLALLKLSGTLRSANKWNWH